MRDVSDAMLDPRRPVVRRFASGHLVIGRVAVVGAPAMLYLFWGLRKIPIIAVPFTRPFADACASLERSHRL